MQRADINRHSGRLRAASYALKTLGVALAITAFGLATVANSKTTSLLDSIIFFTLAGFAGSAAAGCYVNGKRLLAPRLGSDPRPPCLYLRSFRDDERAARPLNAGRPFIPSFSTEEEQLARGLSQIGPLLGFGVPKPVRTEVVSAEEHEWRPLIWDYMAKAALVVLRVGTSDSLLWEVQLAIERLPPTRLMLLVGNRKVYDEFCASATRFFPKGLPQHIKTKGGPLSEIQATVYFAPDWTPHFVPLAVSGRGKGEPLEKALIVAMQPVYEQLGLPWLPPPTYWSSLFNSKHRTQHVSK